MLCRKVKVIFCMVIAYTITYSIFVINIYIYILDILEPLNEDDDYEARTRSLSSIHIKITK